MKGTDVEARRKQIASYVRYKASTDKKPSEQSITLMEEKGGRPCRAFRYNDLPETERMKVFGYYEEHDSKALQDDFRQVRTDLEALQKRRVTYDPNKEFPVVVSPMDTYKCDVCHGLLKVATDLRIRDCGKPICRNCDQNWSLRWGPHLCRLASNDLKKDQSESKLAPSLGANSSSPGKKRDIGDTKEDSGATGGETSMEEPDRDDGRSKRAKRETEEESPVPESSVAEDLQS